MWAMNDIARPDTIVAPATAIGRGAVAIVRISGALSQSIAEKLFRRKHGVSQASWESHKLYFGEIRSLAGELLDEGLAVLMRSPHSFTGEDVLELHLHGSAAVVDSVLRACQECGARIAKPGEFTLRAFLNGRLDLAQAEAVADLVAARTNLAQRLALQQLQGGLSNVLHSLRNELLDVAAELEAWIDFPEEDIPEPTAKNHALQLENAKTRLESLLHTFRVGKLSQAGARVVLLGTPNVGKSSVFNALVGRERAIVTPHAGTTRDTIESTIDIRGIPITLVDTAGLREAHDEIEKIGIERSLSEAEQAEVLMWVIDGSVVSGVEPMMQWLDTEERKQRVIVVINKCDISDEPTIERIEAAVHKAALRTVRVSCVAKLGFDKLEECLTDVLLSQSDVDVDICLVSERHAESISAACQALERALSEISRKHSPEFISPEVMEAVHSLDEILGISTSEEILDRVFSRFCIGK
jgi:tRNA modification GTPase